MTANADTIQLTDKQKARLKARLDATLRRFALDNGLTVHTVKECGTVTHEDGILLQAILKKIDSENP